jgi:PAS domain S-box-containing protein
MRHLEALYRLLERMYRADSLSCIYTEAVEATRTALDCDGVALLLGDEGRGWRCAAAIDFPAESCRALSRSLPGLRAGHGPGPICICPQADVDAALLDALQRERLESLCLVSLVVDGSPLGELAAGFRTPRALDPSEIEVASAIARHLTLAMERQMAQDRLRENEERIRRELSARRRAEHALRDSESRLRFALEAGRMGTWEWSIHSGRMVWSPSLERIHGLQPGSFPGTFAAYADDMHPEDRDEVLASIHRAVARNIEHRMEYRIIWPDGSIHWVEARGRAFLDEDGEPERMIGLCMDITERKRVEQRITALGNDLRRRVEELDALLEVLPVGVLVAHDPDCRHISMNPAAAELLELPVHVNPSRTGEQADQLPFRVLRDGSPVPPEEMPMQRAARTGKPVRGEMLEIALADTIRFEYIIAVPLFDDGGRVRGALGAMIDMTERKRFEDALRAADQRKDEFLATLAHELRNPLAPIRNAIEILRLGPDSSIDPRVPQGVIDRQIRHMTRLLDDLLDVSRISYNKIELRRERIEFMTPVQSALETSRPLIEERGHRFVVSMPEDVLWLYADPVRLAQVFSNLVSNAAKYTPAGGLIEFGAVREGDELLVSVKDNGVGISPAMRSQIFGMFSRGSGSIERAEGGLGIGLSLARALVELHGGRIDVRSEGEGRGSEFMVRLPLASGMDRGEPADADSMEPSAAATARRVLVVDDLKDSADSLAVLLRVTGNKAWTAHDGRSALEAAERLRPDVALLDIGMPDLDGYEVCRRMRQTPWGRDMMLIALTGWGQEGDRRRSLEAGFDHHLVKPVEIPALMRLLEQTGDGQP